ncbi:hypothetical protein ACVTGW_24185 [Citrobacter freundii]|uniref:hypothetical protein n=1 Tax=Enterobacteriaceae TaxID=543 RepID=UPI000299B961|nr:MULTISPECIES: hypothetical protein [Enterobacteriaceae]EKS57213.1 hypothetical protein D186_09918 [Citrobacter freundii ATCC 8090 = MTCC 1658 = NBRC 12681]EKT9307142.1 hypothetical protein [Citrobacter freundii]ELK6212405.1 hypothetical protein [Citrobacter freundii]ELQ6047243.1 hypothetical protein [Cronobacter malonaticus]ELQ6069088.1 hypothetical protein [Cronobacter malonaticus]
MQGRRYSVTCYQQTLEEQLISKWQGPPTTKKPAPAVFNIPNGEKEMQNSSIMALALALCNAEQGQAVKVPAMTGSQLHLLMMWLRALRR